MPRKQTAPLGTIGLQPVARPVNQFVAPEVRYNDNAGGLLQLAQALQVVRPEIGDTLNKLAAVTERDMRKQAKLDASALALKNKQDFRDAVAQGLLKDQHNPWYMAQMEQEVAGAEARAYVTKLQTDYAQNGLMYSKNPQQIDQWVQEATVEMLKGRTGSEAEAIISELDPFRQRMVQGHVEFQAKMTDRERRASILTGLSGILKKYTSDDFKNPQAIAQIQKEVGDFRAERALTFNEDELDDLIFDSLQAESESRTSNVARSVLSGLTRRDGSSLADVQLNRAKLEALDLRVGQLALQRGEQEMQAENMNRQRALNGVLSAAQSESQKQGVPFHQIKFTDDQISQMDQRVYEEILRLQTSVSSHLETKDNILKKNARDAAYTEYAVKAINHSLDPKRKNDLLTILARNDGQAAIENLMQMDEYIERNQWGRTSPQTLNSLYSQFNTGGLTITDVAKLAQDGHLSKDDYYYWTNQVLENRGSWTTSANGSKALAEYGNMAEQFLQVQSLTGDSETGKAEVGAKTALANRLLTEGLRELENDPTFKQAQAPERAKRLDALFDSVMSNQAVGGPTIQGYKDMLTKRVQQAQEAAAAEKVAEEAKRAAAVAKANPKLDETVPQNTFNSPFLPKYDVDSKALLASVIGTGSTFEVNGRKVYDMTQYKPYYSGTPYRYLGGGSDLLTRPVNDLAALVRTSRNNNPQRAAELSAQEISASQKLATNRRALESQIKAQNVNENMDALLAKLKVRKDRGTFYVTPEEKQNVYRWAQMQRQLAYLSKYSTYTVEEVQQMGPQAHFAVPMFYNQEDISSPRFFEVAEKLGIKNPEEQGQFRMKQIEALWRQRNGL